VTTYPDGTEVKAGDLVRLTEDFDEHFQESHVLRVIFLDSDDGEVVVEHTDGPPRARFAFSSYLARVSIVEEIAMRLGQS
jgi:hypothetical protein